MISGLRHPTRLRRAAAFGVVLWGLGVLGSEALQQVAAALMVVLSVLAFGQVNLSKDLRRYLKASVALILWQAASPLWAQGSGVAESWPRLTRYGQLLDSAAAPALAVVASLGVPWLAVSALVGAGWLGLVLLGLYQHRVAWPFQSPAWLRLDVTRLHENFGPPESPRYAAGGLYFHRLRFAHGAIAMLGPALALVVRGPLAQRLWAAAVAVGVLVSAYVSFARAALIAALLVSLTSLVLLWGGRARKLGLAAVGLCLACVLASPAWGDRFSRAVGNLYGGERELAMSVGLRLAKEHPWFGVGFGNHKPAALATQDETGVSPFLANDSHNLWITTWAETGLLGVFLLIWVHVTLGLALLRRYRQGSPLATGALLSWMGFHVLSLVHYLPFHSSVHLSFAFVWGLGLSEEPRST